MDQNQIKRMVDAGKAKTIVSRDKQQRQVVVTPTKLRITVQKGNTQNGKTTG